MTPPKRTPQTSNRTNTPHSFEDNPDAEQSWFHGIATLLLVFLYVLVVSPYLLYCRITRQKP